MFGRARLTLTAWYLLIIMLVSATFSTIIYKAADAELARFSRQQRLRIERDLRSYLLYDDRFIPAPLHDSIDTPDLITDTRRRLQNFLILINSSIFIISGTLGYFLAGKTLQPIKQMVDEQNQFISDASHELKTPLTAMRTSLEVNVRESHISKLNAHKVLKDNLAEVINLQRLSENLLELTAHHPTINMMAVDIDQLINSAVREISPLASSQKIKIEITGDKQTKVTGDFDKLVRAMVAVLDNALKYSPTSKRLNINVKKTGNRLLVAIRDHGPGIPAAELSRVTERFYRADKARSTSGYGLGLAIVERIISSHHGKLLITSKLGHGTTVTFNLPTSV